MIMIRFRTTLERQIQMQDQMRERVMAMQVSNLCGENKVFESLVEKSILKKMQVAKARDLFYWLGSFYVIAGLGMVSGFARYSAYI